MKRLLTVTIILFTIQISKAESFLIQGSLRHMESGAFVYGDEHDTVDARAVKPVTFDIYHNNIYKKRLDSIQKDVPLDYNADVQQYIDTYLSSGRGDISRELGLAKYYFPIYEKAFRDAGIPEEIKYLSIVESQLNPYAVSRVGATGPWQFMSTTARLYGLQMDNYIDERRDPIQSSYAAAAYLKDAYEQFGDWLLAIASYNCGKSEVLNAIEKAGASDYWSVRQYLPVETRGYVPAYIAMTYVMNYYKKYHIIPLACNLSIKTDTVMVDKAISLNSVSRVLGIDLGQLSMLNPAYTRMIINGTAASPKRLVIPQAAKEKYGALYDALNSALSNADVRGYGTNDMDRHVEKRIPVHHKLRKFESLASGRSTHQSYIHYQVHRGDTLSVIANKFEGVSVQTIRELNGLKSSRLQPGMVLKINKG